LTATAGHLGLDFLDGPPLGARFGGWLHLFGATEETGERRLSAGDVDGLLDGVTNKPPPDSPTMRPPARHYLAENWRVFVAFAAVAFDETERARLAQSTLDGSQRAPKALCDLALKHPTVTERGNAPDD
jgi:hypothetical protein